MRITQAVKTYYGKAILVIVLAMLSLFILFLYSLSDMINMQDLIEKYNSPFMQECLFLCQDNHGFKTRSDTCCDITGNDCVKLSDCKNRLVGGCQHEYDRDLPRAIVSSTLCVLLAVACCAIYRLKIVKRPLIEEPVFHSIQQPINRSLITRKDGEDYDSFVHYDKDNTCAVCIEFFNDQKAVMLKCGHIFHEKCIQDWSRKQKNCPVCRSSQ